MLIPVIPVYFVSLAIVDMMSALPNNMFFLYTADINKFIAWEIIKLETSAKNTNDSCTFITNIVKHL